MKNFLFFLLLTPFLLYSQSITPEMFDNPINTGVNMSVAFVEISELDQFQNGIIGAFYDLNNDGVYDCVGSGNVYSDFFIFSLWGDDELTQDKDGLSSGDIPIFAILTSDSLIILLSDLDSFDGYESNAVVFNHDSITTSAFICTDTQHVILLNLIIPLIILFLIVKV